MNTEPQNLQNNPPAWLSLVAERVEGLRYGTVQIHVHDGRVTLIESTEKTRLERARES